MTIAYNDTPVLAHEPHSGLFGGTHGFFSLLARSISAARAYENLSHMSDAELARRGLSRADIAEVAMKVLIDDE